MFFFTKKKPFLADIIPDNYIDIHSHLLPGIDDGAKDLAHTETLIKSLQELGFKKMITTPHIMQYVWENNPEIITAKKETVLENTNAKLNAAAEYMMDEGFISLFKNEKLLTLKDNYVLVEMSYLNAPLNLYEVLFELQVAGYKPVLAHPERYNFFHQKPQEYEKLKKAGCVFQLNLLSAIGYYGKPVLQCADELLAKGLIDFVGSDVHHERHIEGFKKEILLKNHEILKQTAPNNSFFDFTLHQ